MTDFKKPAEAPIWKVILAFGIIYIVWGSTYYYIQEAVKGFPPFILGMLRFLIAGGLMMSWAIYRKEKPFQLSYILPAAVCGFLLLNVGNGSVIWIEQSVESGIVAVMLSSGPLWFVLFDYPKWKSNLTNGHIITGLLIGFAGIVLLFWEHIQQQQALSQEIPILTLFLLLLAPASWSMGSLYSKYKTGKTPATGNISWQMIVAGLLFVPATFIHNEWAGFNWSNISGESWFALWYLIILGSIIGFSAYVWLLSVRPAAQVSTNAYVNPVVAVLIGVFIGNESVSATQIVGLLVVLGSVALINVGSGREVKS
jgi:drug/metabolite transporter (DMT)-like permease